MDMRWARARRTKRITKDTGGNHIMELNRERRRLGSQFSKSPTIRDPRSLFISNVDPEVGHVEIEEFLEYYYGLGTCLVKLYHDKGTGGHKGYGHVHFVDPIQATSALLNFNGVKFGKSNIALSERYTSDYLERQSGAGSTTRRAIASKEF
uniref:RRM domain-containing protein n=1 Tax=Chromera velia CCMP2878 TaxID=1169474 RepID=A0A0G4EZ42_9ALVE|eukprot:Cvel_14341.t1-p1 / transcript=Cvel_14341.t1 / gene=Cvel_14341 / organism=Chromera_velia_CCMP2878 / gene_product=hypothetical protein / transcript_product=hypothetical protein / location=Cvel_scaffold1016:14200-14649(-) / protein_length=150 / sequence_SO=supercontig / SO=protein_coding / is_pseudo=false